MSPEQPPAETITPAQVRTPDTSKLERELRDILVPESGAGIQKIPSILEMQRQMDEGHKDLELLEADEAASRNGISNDPLWNPKPVAPEMATAPTVVPLVAQAPRVVSSERTAGSLSQVEIKEALDAYLAEKNSKKPISELDNTAKETKGKSFMEIAAERAAAMTQTVTLTGMVGEKAQAPVSQAELQIESQPTVTAAWQMPATLAGRPEQNITLEDTSKAAPVEANVEVAPTIETAQTFDELFIAIDNDPRIPKGFAGTKPGDGLGNEGYKWLIKRVANNQQELNSIPNKFGLEDKVYELLNTEAAFAEQAKQQASAEARNAWREESKKAVREGLAQRARNDIEDGRALAEAVVPVEAASVPPPAPHVAPEIIPEPVVRVVEVKPAIPDMVHIEPILQASDHEVSSKNEADRQLEERIRVRQEKVRLEMIMEDTQRRLRELDTANGEVPPEVSDHSNVLQMRRMREAPLPEIKKESIEDHDERSQQAKIIKVFETGDYSWLDKKAVEVTDEERSEFLSQLASKSSAAGVPKINEKVHKKIVHLVHEIKPAFSAKDEVIDVSVPYKTIRSDKELNGFYSELMTRLHPGDAPLMLEDAPPPEMLSDLVLKYPDPMTFDLVVLEVAKQIEEKSIPQLEKHKTDKNKKEIDSLKTVDSHMNNKELVDRFKIAVYGQRQEYYRAYVRLMIEAIEKLEQAPTANDNRSEGLAIDSAGWTGMREGNPVTVRKAA